MAGRHTRDAAGSSTPALPAPLHLNVAVRLGCATALACKCTLTCTTLGSARVEVSPSWSSSNEAILRSTAGQRWVGARDSRAQDWRCEGWAAQGEWAARCWQGGQPAANSAAVHMGRQACTLSCPSPLATDGPGNFWVQYTAYTQHVPNRLRHAFKSWPLTAAHDLAGAGLGQAGRPVDDIGGGKGANLLAHAHHQLLLQLVVVLHALPSSTAAWAARHVSKYGGVPMLLAAPGVTTRTHSPQACNPARSALVHRTPQQNTSVHLLAACSPPAG